MLIMKEISWESMAGVYPSQVRFDKRTHHGVFTTLLPQGLRAEGDAPHTSCISLARLHA
jgi:hypothetical protein